MTGKGFHFGMLTVVMLVALRVIIGYHFLYEGVWKVRNSDEFSARPFLTEAKGPAAELFYAMVPDLDGSQRLVLVKDAQGQATIQGDMYLKAWDEMRQYFVSKYRLDEKQQKLAQDLYRRYASSLNAYLTDNQADMVAYYGALERQRAYRLAGNNGAAHQQERMWDAQQKLRGESGAWLKALDGLGEDYREALWSSVLTSEQRARSVTPPHGPVLAVEALPVSLPFVQTRTELVDFAVTWGLTAIGLCMVLGLFNRLACLGGAVFLLFVVLTQPPWPTIYPPAPPVVGHSLGVDKNVVEMIAMLALATTAVGRWGGLDYFIHHFIGRRILGYFNKNV